MFCWLDILYKQCVAAIVEYREEKESEIKRLAGAYLWEFSSLE